MESDNYSLILFSERLKELMFDKGNIKSCQLGTMLDVSGQSIRAWCNGTQGIGLKNLIKLADYFQCSLDFLVGISDDGAIVLPRPCPPFYDNLRKVMKEKQKTRYYITKYTKIKDKYFSKWSAGSDIQLQSLIALSNILDCTLDHLVGREN